MNLSTFLFKHYLIKIFILQIKISQNKKLSAKN